MVSFSNRLTSAFTLREESLIGDFVLVALAFWFCNWCRRRNRSCGRFWCFVTGGRVSVRLFWFVRGIIFILHHIRSYHVISYKVISYYIISYHTTSYHIISYRTLTYFISTDLPWLVLLIVSTYVTINKQEGKSNSSI